MAITDVLPPQAAAPLDRAAEDGTAKIAGVVDEAFAAKAKLDELTARHRAVVHERDQLQTAYDALAARCDRWLREHAHEIAVTCDVCHARAAVSYSTEPDAQLHALGLVGVAFVSRWQIGTATAAALKIAPTTTSDRDLCHLHRDHQP